MVVLKLKLSSEKPKKVYALNGRSYLLKPGSNTLNLEYNEYVSLAKALGITPVKQNDVTKEEPSSTKPPVDNDTEEKADKTSCCDGGSCSFCSNENETVEESQAQTQSPDTCGLEEGACSEPTTHEEAASVEENLKPVCNNEEDSSLFESDSNSTSETDSDETSSEDSDECSESKNGSTDDYESWSWADLRSEYKRVSGKACKLKKEAVIQFLRENRDVK